MFLCTADQEAIISYFNKCLDLLDLLDRQDFKVQEDFKDSADLLERHMELQVLIMDPLLHF